ncbi:unnamed protein product [Arabidopsis lyrata]|nr:unnamed protein product [Arabidopsis lyrata]
MAFHCHVLLLFQRLDVEDFWGCVIDRSGEFSLRQI